MKARQIRTIGTFVFATFLVTACWMEYNGIQDLWPISSFSLYTEPAISTGGAIVYLHEIDGVPLNPPRPIHDIGRFRMGRNISFVSLVQSAGRNIKYGHPAQKQIAMIESQMNRFAKSFDYSIEHIRFDAIDYYLSKKITSQSTLYRGQRKAFTNAGK